MRRHLLLGELQKALAARELAVFFQAQIDLLSGAIVGAEALVRWKKKDGTFISPAEFIPVAENSGLIKPFTSWVLQESLHRLAQWHQAGTMITVSINLSARNMVDPQLVPELQHLIRETGVPPGMILLEITESSFAESQEMVKNNIEAMHQLGLRQSIDDFGTGYSSLSYLKDLRVDEIKIDQSFVRNLPEDTGSMAIVKSTIQLAHNLGLKVVAEGVENERAKEYLKEAGCDIAQGFLFCRPMPADMFFDYINEFSNQPKSTGNPEH